VTVHWAAAEGFARTAEDYERSRPSYPEEAVAHLASVFGLGPGRRVVDVAAGTGKLTRLLVGTGADVVAVEPVAEMRAILAARAPEATAVDGTAEDLPLPDGSVDVVTVAQAFHWFDGPAALASFHRVLGGGGGLAVVYNQRESPPGWLTDVNRIIVRHRGSVPQREDGRWREAFASTELFTPLELAEFANPQTLSREDAIGRFRSLSFIGALPADDQERLLGEVARVIDDYGVDPVVIPQTTAVWVCRRR
jgi:SAM-dependent methyltransferase